MQRGTHFSLLGGGRWWHLLLTLAPTAPRAAPPTSFDVLQPKTCEQRKLLVPTPHKVRWVLTRFLHCTVQVARYLQNNVKVYSLLGWEWNRLHLLTACRELVTREPPHLMSLPFAWAPTWGGLLATWALLSPVAPPYGTKPCKTRVRRYRPVNHKKYM